MYELAIQAVDPSLSLPYWDYTYDTSDLSTSIMFQESTFGTITFPAGGAYWSYTNDSVLDAAIPDGRWAQAIAKIDDKYENLVNAFGYMRGPWNTNPSPFVSRFSIQSKTSVMYEGLPNCASMYTMLQQIDMATFLDLAPFFPHASSHADIGGLFGCDVLDGLLEAGLIIDEQAKQRVCKKWTTVLKELYRADFITPSSDCSVTAYDRAGIQCGYECSGTASSFTSSLSHLLGDYMPADTTGAQLDDWKDFICNGDGYKIFSGDHFEAASPAGRRISRLQYSTERLHTRLKHK